MCVFVWDSNISNSYLYFFKSQLSICCPVGVLQPQCCCNVTVCEVHLLSVYDVLSVVFLLTSGRYFVTKRVAISGIYRAQHEASHSLWFVLVTRLHVRDSKMFNA